MSSQTIAPELNAAYRIFCEEFRRHLAVLSEEAQAQGAPATEQERETRRRKIENRFHTIRGGAGFFQLDEVYRISTEGEKLFQVATEEEDFLTALEALPELVQALEKSDIPNISAEPETVT